MGVIIEFDKLHFADDSLTRFFALLKAKKQIQYDWAADQLQIKDGNRDTLALTAQEFKKITQIRSFSQADLVLLLDVNGFDVEVINTGKSFKSPEDKQQFFADLKREAQQFPI